MSQLGNEFAAAGSRKSLLSGCYEHAAALLHHDQAVMVSSSFLTDHPSPATIVGSLCCNFSVPVIPSEKETTVFPRLLLLFAIVPLLELWLLIELTKLTSIWWTIALVLSTGMIGMSLVRWQGMKSLRQIQQQLASGQSPSQSIVSGVLILIAGALLLTPGLITDTAGFLLLIPTLRTAFARIVQKRLVGRVVSSVQGSVWVTSFSSNFPQPAAADSTNTAERPSVRVIDPGEEKITND